MNLQNINNCLTCNLTVLTETGVKVRTEKCILTDFVRKVRQLGWLGHFTTWESGEKKIFFYGLECQKRPNHANLVMILVRTLFDPSNRPNHTNYEVISS